MNHPAPFTTSILDAINEHKLLPIEGWILDPFAGSGRVHQLQTERRFTTGVEIEPEWAALHMNTIVGDATALPSHWTGQFAAVVTSPVYGSRMSDHHNAKDSSRRITYTHVLREATGDPSRTLAPNNAGQMYSWQPQYWELHEKAWSEVERVLVPGGHFFLNCSNYIRKGQVEEVVQMHRQLVLSLGFSLVDQFEVETRRLRYGANREARAESEWILVFRKG